MISDNEVHQESKIASGFTKWFEANRNYVELYDDTDTTGGDPFDSAGIIGEKIYLIEFKTIISKSMILYKNSKGSSIEKKIGQVLKQLYQKRDSNIYNSLISYYDDSSIPNIVIVAKRISIEAQKLMKSMFEARSIDWRFNYIVFTWNDEKVNIILENKNKNCSKSLLNHHIKIPRFPSTAPKRNPRLNKKTVIQILDEIGKIEEFNLLSEFISSVKGNLRFNVSSVNVELNGEVLFGIWPFHSDTIHGLRMTFHMERIIKNSNNKISSFNDLGITRSKEKLGYLGYNGYVNNIVEMKLLIHRIKT